MRHLPSCTIADDYATIKIGSLQFYYGYEETVPKILRSEDEDFEYAFVVWKNKKELTRWSATDIKSRVDDGTAKNLLDVSEYLLAGIAAWMKEFRVSTKLETINE
jgi:hypothetical protein